MYLCCTVLLGAFYPPVRARSMPGGPMITLRFSVCLFVRLSHPIVHV